MPILIDDLWKWKQEKILKFSGSIGFIKIRRTSSGKGGQKIVNVISSLECQTEIEEMLVTSFFRKKIHQGKMSERKWYGKRWNVYPAIVL